jgi:predicted O-linked N-acetylglucosamine transferase (SPINDLY family)
MAPKFRDLFKAGAADPKALPQPAELFRSAQSLERRGELAQAAAAYRAILESYPGHWESLNAIATITLQSGDLEGAIRAYDELLAHKVDHAEAYYKRANAHNGLGRLQAALVDYDQSIAINSGYAKAHCNRGTVLERLQRWDEALASYDRAIALDPGDCLAFYNRGSVLKQLERLDEALESYERAIALKGDYVEAYINRGYVLQELQRNEAAVASFDRSIELKPQYAEAFRGRGTSLVALKRFEAAIASFNRAIELNATYAEAYHGRGDSQFGLRQYGAAISSYDQVIALKPDFKFVRGARQFAKAQICDWHDGIKDIQLITEGLASLNAVCEPFAALVLLDSPALQRLAAQVWVRQECPPNEVLGAIAPRLRGDKVRIGYFSADFRIHPVAMLIAELFEMHDRSRFEITAFAFGPEANDAMRIRLERAFDSFIDVRAQSDAEVASLARTLGIDIAVDLGGFTEHSRPKIFALRAAPIQINFLGYPGTSGAPYMDYIVADGMLIPAGSRDHYSEKVVYLPNSYQVNDSTRRIADQMFSRMELQLPESGFVFCCFNNNFKIRADTFESWMRILAQVEKSVLWLLEDNPASAANLRKEAANRGIDPNRLVFAKRVPPPQHLARQRTADLFLDTAPYNAHTTASDALRVGLPVVTLIGESFAGRVASSLLSALNLPELITSTREEYEALAVRLATDPGMLGQIRQKLEGNRRTAPLFDTPLFARHVETAYMNIFKRYQSGLPPDHNFVESD